MGHRPGGLGPGVVTILNELFSIPMSQCPELKSESAAVDMTLVRVMVMAGARGRARGQG